MIRPTTDGAHMKLFSWLPFSKKKVAEKPVEVQKPVADPIDPFVRLGKGSPRWDGTESSQTLKTVADFPFHTPSIAEDGITKFKGKVMDEATISATVMDSSYKNITADGPQNSYTVPPALQNWYMSQSFIGYQACALIAQHWLVNQACSMVGRDAVRKGWDVKSSSNVELSVNDVEKIKDIDRDFKVSDHLVEAERFKNIFGIRVMIFVIDSPDKDYYSKPFNPDGITKGSYKGISQVDPYWMMPMMTAESTNDPSNMHFYEPEYWIISGQRYHRSHLMILRNDEPADILKPTYLFGGVPLTQQIYERVYAAERTANEAPLLAMSKRTTTIHTDVDKAILNEESFTKRLLFWTKFRDNHAVKVLGKEETMDQYDTNLSDFDSVIMNQYQLVSSIAKVPSTKLLGTSPKGFNATGEFEMISYHEELETCQKHDLTPILDRHYLILTRSLGVDIRVKVVWEPVGSLTAKQQAEINEIKARTGRELIEAGVISPDEERERVKDDRTSGYNRLTEEEAETVPGYSPENIALIGKSAGEVLQGQADLEQAKSDILKQSGTYYENTGVMPEGSARGELAENPSSENVIETGVDENNGKADLLKQLGQALIDLQDHKVQEGIDIGDYDAYQLRRTTQPSVQPSVKPSTLNLHHSVGKMDKQDLPKMKLHGMMCYIENPRNSVRRGNTLDGAWAIKMPHHYGFIKGTKGADGDEVDCFIGKNLQSPKVYVVNQNDNYTGEFDEHKCMLGFDSAEEAKEAYMSAYGHGWKGFDSIHEMDVESFKQWVNGDCSSPLSAANLANENTNSPKHG